MPRVAPSILAADFDRLGAQVQEVLDAGARVIHVDVMDGHFVPPLTMGPLVVAALRERVGAAGAMIEVHLMIERPERQIAEFARAGADLITIHAEATPHLDYALAHIREAGLAAGLAVCPSTPLEVYREVAEKVDLALCMTVNPGLGRAGLHRRLDRARCDRLAPLVRRGRRGRGRRRHRSGNRRALPRPPGRACSSPGPRCSARADPAAAYVALAEAVGDPRR